MPEKQSDKENLRAFVAKKYNDQGKPKGVDINSDIGELLQKIFDHKDHLKRNNTPKNRMDQMKRDINRCFASKNFRDLLFLDNSEGEESEDLIKVMCLVGKDTVEKFIIKKSSGRKMKPLDFMSVYVGYAGWKGFKSSKPVTLAECFFIGPGDEDFLGFDINGYSMEESIIIGIPKDNRPPEVQLLEYIDKTDGLDIQSSLNFLMIVRANEYFETQNILSKTRSRIVSVELKINLENE